MEPYVINSISELHRLLELPQPRHPLISIFRFEDITCYDDQKLEAVAYNFYCVALKKNFNRPMRYGQQEYDFDEGLMSFIAPGQVFSIEILERDENAQQPSGCLLLIHPDFLWDTSLAKTIKQYEFFDYAVNESLFLSEKEETTITGILG